jgi:hypothetical protein
MAKVKRHVELEEVHLNELHRRFPGTSLSHIINELLFHFHNIILEQQPDLSEFYRDAAERTGESIKH